MFITQILWIVPCNGLGLQTIEPPYTLAGGPLIIDERLYLTVVHPLLSNRFL
jgi:hypothetical protein